MAKRVVFAVLFLACVAFLVWQGSFSFGDMGPGTPEQTLLLWAVSSAVVILTLTLTWMLIRTLIKLYLERQANREGSRLRTKLVVGALGLTLVPVCFLVFFSVEVLNRNLDKWFSRPADTIRNDLINLGVGIEDESQGKAQALARWLAGSAKLAEAAKARQVQGDWKKTCDDNGIANLTIEFGDGSRLEPCHEPSPVPEGRLMRAAVAMEAEVAGSPQVVVETRMPIDVARLHAQIEEAVDQQNRLAERRRDIRAFYVRLLMLITLFILFLATWVAIHFAKQISVPIAALLNAAEAVRRGDLSYRIQVTAADELASLVRAFNEMTHGLAVNRQELERRQRFVEAILENIPTGVISVTAELEIQSVNRALRQFVADDVVLGARRLNDLFDEDDVKELRYLINRARRTRLASNQIELTKDGRTIPVNVTVSALEDQWRMTFIIVLEDTSELLRVQKMEAWQEVARSVAHEIKNPLTPIALSAERIVRQLERLQLPASTTRIIRECASTIDDEVNSLKSLVDEFSQAARFPAAQPTTCDLNEIVENALGVFAGRLAGIEVTKNLEASLPPVNVDREQLKRALVNLVDNAAEAMDGSLVKRLYVSTRRLSSGVREDDLVELVVADTGHGVSPESKEKLFVPYFSTKNRGSGLGLTIVSHILNEHRATIRVEDNRPAGAAFIVEIPAAVSVMPEPQTAGLSS